jgi:hypothetical protein
MLLSSTNQNWKYKDQQRFNQEERGAQKQKRETRQKKLIV